MPFDDRITYICVGRDPRDVAVSWDGHATNINLSTFFALREAAVGVIDLGELLAAAPPLPSEIARERFWFWVEPPAPGTNISDLEILLHHLDTFWQVRDQPNIILLRYEDLLDDLEGQMRYVADRLGIGVAETVWPQLVRAATFDDMRVRASGLAAEASHTGFYTDRDAFFRKGSTEQWREVIGRRGTSRYIAGWPNAHPPTLAPGSIAPRCSWQTTARAPPTDHGGLCY